MGADYMDERAREHRRDIVDPESQRWINEFVRITAVSRDRAAFVWGQHGKTLTPLEAAGQLGYTITDDRLRMEHPEDAAEQSNRIPEANRGRLTATEVVERNVERERMSPRRVVDASGEHSVDYAEIDDLLEHPSSARPRFVAIDRNIRVHDFGLVSSRTVGKKGATVLGWRVIEFAREENNVAHLRIRGEFDHLDDAQEFLTLLRSNEALEALSRG